MFKNFQEQFMSAEESQHAAEFRLFNPRHERLKLIISAILIPVGCSVFYFLLSGHKYAELESAIGNTESVQTLNSTVTQSSSNQDIAATDDEPAIQLANTKTGEKPVAQQQSLPDDSIKLGENSASTLNTLTLVSDSQSKPAPIISEIDAGDSEMVLIEPENAEPILATASLTIEEISSGRNLAELTELLIADDIFKTHTDSAYNNSIPGRGQTEVASLVTKEKDSTLPIFEDEKVAQTTSVNSAEPGEADATDFHDSKYNQIASDINNSIINDPDLTPLTGKQETNTNDGLLANARPANTRPLFLPALTYVDRVTRLASVTASNNTSSNDTDAESTATKRRQQQLQKSKIIMADKIVGLLKSEIINPNATADTGKHKLTNRHISRSKKSFNIDKLESILEDI